MTKYFTSSIRRTAMKVRNRRSGLIVGAWFGVTLMNVLTVKDDLLAGTLDVFSQISLLICFAGFYVLGTRSKI